MFRNPGEKIKIWAWVAFVLGCVGSVIGGISFAGQMLVLSATLAENGVVSADPAFAAIFGAILIVVAGVLASWLGALLLFSWGRVVTNTDRISRCTEWVAESQGCAVDAYVLDDDE